MACTKILCAVDFSTHSHVAVEEAGALAARCGAGLTLVHVYPPPPRPAELTSEMLTWTPADLEAETSRELEPKMKRLRAEAEAFAGAGKVESRLLAGDAAAEIARLAADGGYDLVVVGTHGRTGVKRLVLGSVAERVVRTAPVSVLVVRGRPCLDFSGED